ncbi:alkene reductase [Legionella dresdenensis]|uniref:Alkene reductase n=1 Tax=Legionella dresdenensis TaxID=450200 RepID=A0ABV8CEF7_9GAMM
MDNNNSEQSDLFQPVQMGSLHLPNRIVMAPLTRSRAGENDVPREMNATYYSQRATAGLIISEATQISPQGKGYAFTPGIYSPEQVAGWQLVTRAVHQAGGRIFAQLWHVGRISHPDLQSDNQLPVAPSALKPEGRAYTNTGFKPFVTPRALETDELPGIIAQYAHAAACAKKAGFDGIEIHAANGYLLDQFMRDKTNLRTDQYGGSIENRTRLALEVIDAVTRVWPAERVGIRISPISPLNDIADSNPQAVFGYLAEQLNRFKLAYIHCVEGTTIGPRDTNNTFDFQKLRHSFNGLYMANNGYDRDLAIKARQDNLADLIAFGRPFIANPDLVDRLLLQAPLAQAPRETWYGGDEHGYTDWPALK